MLGLHAKGGRPVNRSQEWYADAALIVRWIARIGSLIAIGFLLAFLFGEGGDPTAITPSEWLLLLFFPVGVVVGMIIGWWKDGAGGLISVGSLALFYLVEAWLSGNLADGFFFAIFTFPGVLFLISWWLDHQPHATDDGHNMRGAHG